MRILINASNLGNGGATQVADSICRNLYLHQEDYFVVVLRSRMGPTINGIKDYGNVKVVQYDFANNWRTRLLARDTFLDNLLKEEQIDVVLSIFAPTWWRPRCPHLAGFALAHLVMPESPYYKMLSTKAFIKQKVSDAIMKFFYWRSSDVFYTENAMITERLARLFPRKKIHTVTNCYNQVFDSPSLWVRHELPKFDGVTLLTLSNAYPHKNLQISLDIARILHEKYPEFKFRFVFTVNEDSFPPVPEAYKDCFVFLGPVDIRECPYLYEQCDIAFQPTLLECFTATYPEAMRMGKPIVTTDLSFAKGLCGDAALYYEPLSAEDAAHQIYRLANDPELCSGLGGAGEAQLQIFDNNKTRVTKLLEICRTLV